MAQRPARVGFPVTYRQLSWLEMCERAWGSEWGQPLHGVYTFSNGRRFDSSDMYQSGIYRRGIDKTLTLPTGQVLVTGSGEDITGG